jgi:hypothetical protein
MYRENGGGEPVPGSAHISGVILPLSVETSVQENRQGESAMAKTNPDFRSAIIAFYENESGAVTVDWVVLTAAIIGLGAAVSASVGSGTTTLATTMESALSGSEIASYTAAAIPTYGLIIDGNLIPVAEVCSYQDSGQISQGGTPIMEEVCTPREEIRTLDFEMSDGSTWTQSTHYIDSSPPVETVTWYNGDGVEVDAPEAS